ncbi:MAG: hydantoinase/oxoprolinase N-terminal domain-containing protein, partial [Thermodesulfobacteriota bacterium]
MIPEIPTNIPLAVGLDTGGTFTDAVLVEMKGGRVLKTAKHPTTHHRLGLGISRALEAVTAGVPPERVRRMAFSTTLATNAVVEGQGARVGLLVIGDVKTFDLPVVSVRYVDGGHDHLGREVRPLDLEALTDALAELAGHVDAYV